MGLDIALGVIIFLAAIRGWLKGFLSQVVRIAGLIACVFAADPLRREARPYVAQYFASIQPAMLDRILWWLACAISYIVIVGVASLLLAILRRPDEDGIKAAYPSDRFAGFLLGAAKGAFVAMLVTAGLEKYALSQLKTIPWVEQQVTGSKAIVWNQTYEPVPLIWQSKPVQQFVNHVQKMGMQAAEESPTARPTPPAGQVAERSTAKSESRPPRLEVAPDAGKTASLSSRVAEIDAALNNIKSRVEGKPNGAKNPN